jgi:hypothetical protein
MSLATVNNSVSTWYNQFDNRGTLYMKVEIDVSDFTAQIKVGKEVSGKDEALTPLIKQLTEMALQAKLETHLSQDLEQNRKIVLLVKQWNLQMESFN